MSARFVAHAVVVFSAGVVLCLASCSKNSTGGGDVDDGTAPTTISDLAVVHFSDSSVTLVWTASGDDRMTGTAASYDLRKSAAFITWDNFDSASRVTGLPAPKAGGQAEQYEVRGLDTDSTYYFALRVFDENGNYDGSSNCVGATCFNDFSVSFPDAALLAVIRDNIGKPSGDILKSDLVAVTNLPAADQSIADLTGLEYCENLTMLNIINNSVSDLSPLTHLDKLAQIHAGNNAIADITPLAGLTDLTWLRLNLNQIADLTPLTGLTGLTDLDLQGNIVVDPAPVAMLTNLESVNLSYNQIRNIGSLLGNAGLGAGDDIFLSQNPLEHESVVTHIPALRARGANVYWTPNTLAPGAITDLDVNTVTATSVTLNWTAPGEDYHEGIAYLYELRYSTERSELEDWSGGQTVSGLPIPDTAGTVQSAVVSGLTEGTTYYFALRTQDNSENWSEVSNIAWAQPHSDIVVTFVDPALEAAIRSAVAKPTGDIYRSDLAHLDTLVANDLGISDLTGLEHCASLRTLHLINNSIGDVDHLAGLVGLYDLNLQGNNITDITPLSSLGNLGVLQLSGNSVGSLTPLAALDNIWFLALSFVGADDIQPLSSMPDLRYLLIVGNGTSDISPLSSCTHLTYFVGDHNSIADISALGGLAEMTTLSLKANLIEDISPLVGNAGLASGDQVALDGNPLSTESINTHIPTLQARGVTVTF